MPFKPEVNDVLNIDQQSYFFTEHPVLPGYPYGQSGRMATVYQIQNTEHSADQRALKVVLAKYRQPFLVSLSDHIQRYADLPGLAVCKRTVLSPLTHSELTKAHPDILYAPLMPWIQGSIWTQIVSEKWVFTPQQSLDLAHSFLTILVRMEEEGLAHCDLSGSNIVMRSTDQGWQIELIDVEQLYATDLNRPPALIAGSPGYAHKTAPQDIWGLEADRFSGAVLLAEILGFCDPQVREYASEEGSYFSETEVQEESDKLQILREALVRFWGDPIQALFDRAWNSDSLKECASFGEWLIALPPKPNEGQAKGIEDTQEAKDQPSINAKPAISEPAPLPVGDPHSPLKGWRQLDIDQKPFVQSASPVAPEVKPQAEQKQSHPAADPVNLPTNEWKVNLPKFDRNKAIWAVFGLIAISGLVVFLFSFILDDLITAVWIELVNLFGDIAISIGNAIVMSALIGIAQLWVFRYRLRDNKKRAMFFLATIAAGILGGAIGHFTLGRTTTLVGAIAGAVTGGFSSFFQSLILYKQAQPKWIVWNIVSWSIIWLIGWTISWGVNSAFSLALAAGFMVTASGGVMAAYLRFSPEVEI